MTDGVSDSAAEVPPSGPFAKARLPVDRMLSINSIRSAASSASFAAPKCKLRLLCSSGL